MADLAAGAAAVMPPSLQEASSYDYTQAPSYAGYKPHSTRTENTSVFVCNLAFKVSEDWLHRLFRKCGEIKSFKLVTDRESGRHKGFGFVEFVTTEGAATAVRTLDGYEVCTRLMRVSFADQDAYKPIAEVGGKFSEMRTARDVLHGFELRKRQLRPNCVVTCWGTLGKLVRQSSEECEWMKAELRQSNALASLLESTLQMVPRLEPTTVATVAYGAASVVSTTGFSLGEQVWEALAAKGLDLANQIRPQGLANLVNAFAKAKHPAPALFDAIALVAPPRMRDFTPQELANTAWAYATAQHSAPALFDAIAAEAARQVRDFKPQELTNTAWAYAKAQHAAPALLDAIAAEARRQVRNFKPQHLANAAWSYATLQHGAPALFDAIAAEAAQRLRDFAPQETSNLAWAYAAADHSSCEVLFGSAAFVAHCKSTQAAFMHSSLAQLHQWQLWLEERGIAWPRLPLPLAERCHAAFLSKAQGEPSNLQRHVVRALKALGLEPREEVLTPQGYSLDAVVRIEGCEVAIEVDGPFHFVGRDHWVGSLAGVPPVGVHLTGSTALKRRQLRAAGWALVSLPYWEWNKFESHDARCAPWQRELLLRELGGAVRSSRPHVIKDGGSSSADRFVSRFVREDGDSLHKKRKMEGGMSALPVVVPPPSSILSQLPPSAQMLRGVPMAQHSSGGAGTPRVAHGLAKWECGRCSFLNNGTLTECEMCGRVRVVHITNPLPAPSPPCSPPSPTTASDTTKLQALPQALTESQPKFPPKNNLKEDERRRWKEMEGEDGRRSFSRRMPRTS